MCYYVTWLMDVVAANTEDFGNTQQPAEESEARTASRGTEGFVKSEEKQAAAVAAALWNAAQVPNVVAPNVASANVPKALYSCTSDVAVTESCKVNPEELARGLLSSAQVAAKIHSSQSGEAIAGQSFSDANSGSATDAEIALMASDDDGHNMAGGGGVLEMSGVGVGVGEGEGGGVAVTKRRFSCPHCAYQSERRGHVTRHLQIIHLRRKPFSCPLCGEAGPPGSATPGPAAPAKPFSMKHHLRRHLQRAHGIYDANLLEEHFKMAAL